MICAQNCTPGTYKTGIFNHTCTTCPSGTFSPSWNQHQCQLWSDCTSGKYIAANSTSATNRICNNCSYGKYSTSTNAYTCMRWQNCSTSQYILTNGTTVNDRECGYQRNCSAGEYISSSSSMTSNRQCSACLWGKYSTSTNAFVCSNWTACSEGTFISTNGTNSSDQACSDCPWGRFSGLNAHGCLRWKNCSAGKYVSTNGSSTSNRVCSRCDSGRFSTVANAHYCSYWKTCFAGKFIAFNGTNTSDRVCHACAWGTYSSMANKMACVHWTNCSKGQKIMVAGTRSVDRRCVECPAGQFSSITNQIACANWAICPPGQRIAALGNNSTDRKCTDCPPGQYSVQTNEESCTNWTICNTSIEFERSKGSSTSDRSCEQLPSPTINPARMIVQKIQFTYGLNISIIKKSKHRIENVIAGFLYIHTSDVNIFEIMYAKDKRRQLLVLSRKLSSFIPTITFQVKAKTNENAFEMVNAMRQTAFEDAFITGIAAIAHTMKNKINIRFDTPSVHNYVYIEYDESVHVHNKTSYSYFRPVENMWLNDAITTGVLFAAAACVFGGLVWCMIHVRNGNNVYANALCKCCHKNDWGKREVSEQEMAELQKQQWEGIKRRNSRPESVERYFKQLAARQAHMLELSKAAAKSNTLSNSKRSLPHSNQRKKIAASNEVAQVKNKNFSIPKRRSTKRFRRKSLGEPKEVMNPMFGGKIASKGTSAKKMSSSKSNKQADEKVIPASENVEIVLEATPPASSRRASSALPTKKSRKRTAKKRYSINMKYT